MIIYYEHKPPINLDNVESMDFPSTLKYELAFYMNSGETLYWQFQGSKERKKVFDFIRDNYCDKIPKQEYL